MRPLVHLIDLGTMDYGGCWQLQQEIFDFLVQTKISRAKSDTPIDSLKPLPNFLLMVEHPAVYTLGKSGSSANLLVDQIQLEKMGISFFKTNRGGDITHHGPGQLVVYPIFDLEQFFTDIGRYMRNLEEAVIQVLADYGLHAERYSGYTGVWFDTNLPLKARKICAMGVRTSRWVSMHGLAFNVKNDLKYFDYIIPCGISDKQVTSLERELQSNVDLTNVKLALTKSMAKIFDFEVQQIDFKTIQNILHQSALAG